LFTDVSRRLISAFPAGQTFSRSSAETSLARRYRLSDCQLLFSSKELRLISLQDEQACCSGPHVLASEHLDRDIPTMTSNLRRRTRKPVSCEACRRHKLRCDRQNPCGSCRRRSCESSCTYVQKATSTQRALPSPDESRHSDLGVEELVPTSRLGIDESLDNACPATRSNNDYTTSQWDALLQRPTDQTGESTSHATLPQLSTQFPFHIGLTRSSDELLALLPPAHCCDYLITQYFVRLSPIFHILHGPTFQSQYRTFSQNSREVDLAWLALLFAMCSVSVHTLEDDDAVLAAIRLKQGQPQDQERAAISYQLRAAAMACLSQDNFMVKHRLSTLEALLVLIYTISNYEGVERGWALLGNHELPNHSEQRAQAERCDRFDLEYRYSVALQC
jgi:hypothetical protein